jgi:hypothetical protein
VTLAPDSDQIYVTHLRPASSPAQSINNLENFLVTLHQADLDQARAAWATDGGYVVPDTAFSSIGRGASNSIVVTRDFLYVSGRAKLVATDPDVLLRVVDRSSNLIAYPQLQLVWASVDARALQLRPDGQRLYLAVDNPAALLVVDITSPPQEELAPSFTLVRAVPLPAGPNDVQLLTRPGRAPLVVVSCSIDGSLAFYDDDLGQIAALIPGVGAVPFAIAIDRRGDWARLYVSNFGDGRIAVVDVPLAESAAGGRFAPHLVAHVGQSSTACSPPTTAAAWTPPREDETPRRPRRGPRGLLAERRRPADADEWHQLLGGLGLAALRDQHPEQRAARARPRAPPGPSARLRPRAEPALAPVHPHAPVAGGAQHAHPLRSPRAAAPG